MRKSPDDGALPLPAEIRHTQPVLPLPQASCTPPLTPPRTMPVDGTAASETAASAVTISFFVFDI
jgi:hypothetical protein